MDPNPRIGRGWAAAVATASLIGLGVSIYLTRLHVELFYGAGVAESLCDLGNGFNCSAVNGSPESESFGIPQSVLAVPAYVVAGLLGVIGCRKEWVGLTPATAATKGGSYSSGDSARCGYFRDDVAPDTRDPATGFRCCSGPPDPSPPPVRPGRDVGEKLDALTFDSLEGGSFKTRSLAGKPAVVTFWASWCAPGQKEMPALATLYGKYKDRGLQIVGISVDTDEAKLRTWLGAHAMPFTIARDPGGKLMDTFTNRGLPTTLWVRKDGTIRLRTTGVPPGGEKRLGELVDELLGG